MRYLSFLIFIILIHIVYAQSPHGTSLNYDCSTCHEATNWNLIPNNILFKHNETGFELVGQHKSVDCTSCHESLIFNEVKKDCFSCHTDIHQTTLGNECSDCHTTFSWGINNINEIHQKTRFPLIGRHQTADCIQCHTQFNEKIFEPLNIECSACHLETFNQTKNPNHISAGISTECQTCHNLNSWIPAKFNHETTGFPLIGKHLILECSSCHKSELSGLQRECQFCHLENYNSAPNHLIQNYPLNCEMCHNSVSWNQTNFNHNATIFPLTGAHITTDCSSCHTSGFTGTTTVCSDCHIENYNLSLNPSHTALQLPTDCNSCHSTNPNWEPATFAIHNNYYQLIGAHSAIANDCFSCHNGNYNTTPNTCFGCHQNDYNSSTNPPHQSAGFPVDCVQCHNQNVWRPSTFNHDQQFFPIFSGKHRNAWVNCSDCHTNSNNFSVFSCIDCHAHNQFDMNREHSDVNGYVYESTACLSCHPTGEDNILKKRFESE